MSEALGLISSSLLTGCALKAGEPVQVILNNIWGFQINKGHETLSQTNLCSKHYQVSLYCCLSHCSSPRQLIKKESIQFGLAYSLRGIVLCHHGRKYDGGQVAMMLEEDLRLLHLDLQAAGRGLCPTRLGLKHLRPPSLLPHDIPPPIKSYLLQQDHIS